MLRLSRVMMSTAADPLVKVAQKGAVVTLTLNRPKALNSLNGPLVSALLTELQRIDADPAVNVAIVTGEGRAFVAGADIELMEKYHFADWWHKDMISHPLRQIQSIRKPIIAAVNGFAFGGGCELAMACDFIVASDRAKFGQLEVKLGTIPGLGGTQRLTRAIGKSKAMEWCLTGDQYSAEEAERAGLVARVVKHEDLLPATQALAEKIAAHGQIAIGLAKDCVKQAFEGTLQQGLDYESRCFQLTFATKDQKEGMGAFLGKRKPTFTNW